MAMREVSAAEERVLGAAAAITTDTLRAWIRRGYGTVTDLARAELARRGEPDSLDRVLAALSRIPEQDLIAWLSEQPITAPEAYEELARAELARREGGT